MFALLATALASIQVVDQTACVDQERLANELGLLLGTRFDDLDVHVTVVPDGEDRQTRTEVRERGEMVWKGRLDGAAGDCEALPEALALTIHSGLGALPGWSWDKPPSRDLVRWSVAMRLVAGFPLTTGIALDLGPDVRLLRALGVWSHARVSTGLPSRVGSGSASLTSLTVATGLQVDHRRVRAWTGLETGAVWAVGKGFGENLVATLPRIAWDAGLAVRLNRSLFVGQHVQVPLGRIELLSPDGEARESPLYVGLSVGLRTKGPKKLDLSEVERIGRALGSR